MKVVFFGTPEFAVPTLQRLAESRHEVLAAISQPDKPKGRGRRMAPTPVKTAAEVHGIQVLQPESVKTDEFLAELKALDADVGVVVAYGKILPRRVLDAPRHGCLNVHASLLPKFRGAAPIQWAIVNGETQTGVTIMQMDEGMDTGPIVVKEEVEILEDDDAVSIANMLSLMGAQLLVKTLDRLEDEGGLEKTPQNDDEATRAPLIKRAMAEIDWTRDFESIINLVRGFKPWPKTFTNLKDMQIKITGMEACDPAWVPSKSFDERLAPGTVVDIFKGRGFVVKTGGERGVVLVTKVQPEGKQEMGAYDFANGGGIEVGQTLGK